MKKVKRMKRILMLLIAFLIVLTGLYFGYKYLFKSEDPKNNTKEEDKKDPEPVVVPKLKIVDIDSNSRSFAIMINNHNYARPNHAGLQDAYMVYEMIVEGGITRMMAVYKDQDTAKIGSVRSARHYYLDYALENDAIYVHFGGSPQAYSDISALGVRDIDAMNDGTAFWRDNTLNVPYEHKAFTSLPKLEAVVARKNYRATTTQPLLLKYSIPELDVSTLEGAIIANNVSIPYSTYMTASYVYDAVAKVYNRFANGVAHTDAVTKLQYTAKNIITYKVANHSIDSYGRQTLSNIGSGTGYYITDGYAAPITWSKSSRGSQTVYKYLNGSEIVVNDGNTFIQIQPSIQGLTIN